MAHAGSLSAAAAVGNIEVVESMIAAGALVDEPDTLGNTALHHACLAGFEDVILKLLELGASAEAVNIQGKTSLHFATHNGSPDVVALLLHNAKANVHHQDKEGKTPLLSAVANNFVEVAILLIEAGAGLDWTEASTGNTLLHKVVMKGLVESARLLYSYGIDVNKRNNDGRTAIELARDLQYEDIVNVLQAPAPAAGQWWDDADVVYDDDVMSAEQLQQQQQQQASHVPAAASASQPSLITQVQRETSAGGSNDNSRTESIGAQRARLAAARAADASAASNTSRSQSRSRKTAVVLYRFEGTREDELDLEVGEELIIMEVYDDGWCMAELQGGLIGMCPSAYCRLRGEDDPIAMASATLRGASRHNHGSTLRRGATSSSRSQSTGNSGGKRKTTPINALGDAFDERQGGIEAAAVALRTLADTQLARLVRCVQTLSERQTAFLSAQRTLATDFASLCAALPACDETTALRDVFGDRGARVVSSTEPIVAAMRAELLQPLSDLSGELAKLNEEVKLVGEVYSKLLRKKIAESATNQASEKAVRAVADYISTRQNQVEAEIDYLRARLLHMTVRAGRAMETARRDGVAEQVASVAKNLQQLKTSTPPSPPSGANWRNDIAPK